jgi:hypothetical protein
MLRLRDARTGELTDVLPAGRRQLRILVHAPGPFGAGQLRAYLTADLLRRAAEISQLLPLVSDFLPASADVASLRAAGDALNVHPPRETFLGPATALAGVPPFDIGIAAVPSPGEAGQIEGSARLWARVPHAADAVDIGAEPGFVRLRLLQFRYGEPVADAGGLGGSPAGGPAGGSADTAAQTLGRWRSLVARWARSPSGAMSRPHADAIARAFGGDLDTPAALRVLAELADDPGVPDGVKFETFAAADRLLGLDLARDVGKEPGPALLAAFGPRGELRAEGAAELGAQPEVVPEVVDEGTPPGRVDVLRAGHHDALVGVNLQDLGRGDEEAPRRPGLQACHPGFHLQRALGHPGRPDQFRALGAQPGGRELGRLVPERAQLARGNRAAPGQPGQPLDRRPQLGRGEADHQVRAVAEVPGGLAVRAQAKDDHLTERPCR